jgi:protoporphyrinogen IX oxidase
MLWLKALHIFFVIAWFVGLFYLPRLFVNHASAADEIGIERFKGMERRLFVMMTIGAVFASIFGLGIVLMVPGYLSAGWLHAKLTLVIALIGYHVWCYRLMIAFRENRNTHSDKWFRLFNEVPTIILLAVLFLVVLKPF